MHEHVRAERSAAAMMEADHATHWFGMTLSEIRPGYARMELTVREDHLNGHGTCHGGVIFALADSAFAFACNSNNQRAVAQTNQITYISPAKADEKLTATAEVITRSGRTGITDVNVLGADDRLIAVFRGASRQIPGQHFQEDAPES
ncbi:MAG: hydroxyphenylacetyl-CoA thioesterase PaaI [Pseudomonadota bacterium]